MTMFPMTVVIIVIVMLPMLVMVFFMYGGGTQAPSRQSKHGTEEIDNLQRLGLDAMMEPVTSPSARAVMMDSTVTS